VGPEGSVLVFVVIAGMWVVFDRTYPQKANSPQRHRDTEEPA
jgi:hypothetical protein